MSANHQKSPRRFYRQLFSQNPLPIAIQDLSGRYVYVNPAYERLFGHTDAELLGQSFIEVLVPQEFRKGVRAEFLRLVAARQVPAPSTHLQVTATGEERLVRYNFDFIRDDRGAPTATLVIGMDVTDDLPEEPTEGGLLPQFVLDELTTLKPLVALLQVNLRAASESTESGDVRRQLHGITGTADKIAGHLGALVRHLQEID